MRKIRCCQNASHQRPELMDACTDICFDPTAPIPLTQCIAPMIKQKLPLPASEFVIFTSLSQVTNNNSVGPNTNVNQIRSVRYICLIKCIRRVGSYRSFRVKRSMASLFPASAPGSWGNCNCPLHLNLNCLQENTFYQSKLNREKYFSVQLCWKGIWSRKIALAHIRIDTKVLHEIRNHTKWIILLNW